MRPFITPFSPKTKEVIMTPQYLHDCESCTFLGQHGSADLYVCNQFDCIIVRYSSQDSDNVAYRWDIIERFGIDSIDNIDVIEAYYRAIKRQKELDALEAYSREVKLQS